MSRDPAISFTSSELFSLVSSNITSSSSTADAFMSTACEWVCEWCKYINGEWCVGVGVYLEIQLTHFLPILSMPPSYVNLEDAVELPLEFDDWRWLSGWSSCPHTSQSVSAKWDALVPLSPHWCHGRSAGWTVPLPQLGWQFECYLAVHRGSSAWPNSGHHTWGQVPAGLASHGRSHWIWGTLPMPSQGHCPIEKDMSRYLQCTRSLV